MQALRLLYTTLFISCSLYAEYERAVELDIFKDCAIEVGMPDGWIEYLNSKLAQLSTKHEYQNSDTNLLFYAYPELQKKLPYVKLANLPTPVEKLPSISSQYGVQVYIKRDDLTAGTLLYGGNKVRKLEFLLAQAKFLGAEKVLTFGCVGSNHAVATAVHARRVGLEPICLLKHQPPSQVVQQNLLMHLNSNSELHYSANNSTRKLLAIMLWIEHYKKDGKAPYIIPTGGSNIFGTIGFVNAVFELAQQIKQGVMPAPTHIYLACGSCATTAGILLGCKAAGLKAQVVAIAVEPDETSTFAENIDRLFMQTNSYLHALDSSFPVCSYTDQDLCINLEHTGPDYGIFTPEGVAAADQMLVKEHIKLEGTYTAKACACMLADVRKNSGAVVLFWNTYCGLDFSAQFTKHDYHQLPRCLHYYFDDANLQPLDRKA